MPAPTKFWFVVPTVEEIAASGNRVSVSVETTIEAAKRKAISQALVANKERIVVEAVAYAETEVDPATITAQITNIT